MTDEVAISAIASVASLAGLIATGMFAYMTAKLNTVSKTVDKVHDLTNSASLIQLKLYAAALHRISDGSKNESDIKATEDVDNLVKERVKEQEAAALRGKL